MMKKRVLDIQFCPGCKLFIVCVEDSSEIELFAAKNNITTPDDRTDVDGLFSKQDHIFHIIFHKDTTHGDIAHEVVHFLNTAYTSIGQLLDADNDEIYCHLVSYFTNECIALHSEYNKKVNAKTRTDIS
jgi:uncharacterized protein YbaR (Trm112 family)